jgi:hypothetical protein
MGNSRLKDYFDIYVLLENENLNQATLIQAILQTFSCRKTAIPKQLPIGLTDEFANNPSRQAIWHAFLKKNDLKIISLIKVIEILRDHLKNPLMEASKMDSHAKIS